MIHVRQRILLHTVFLPAASLVAALASGPARAATYVWKNLSDTWKSPAGWVGGTPPSGLDASDILIFGGDVGTTAGVPPNYTATSDTALFQLNGIQLNATDAAALPADPAILLTGGEVRLAGPAPSILQNNAGAFTLDLALASEADLSLGGDGSGPVTCNNGISGFFDMIKTGASTFRFGTPPPVAPAPGAPSENTWMGRLIINDGTMRFNNNAYSGPTALRANPETLTAAGAVLTCSAELRTGTLNGTAGLVQSQVTGTNTGTENLVIQAITPGTYGGTVRLGPPTGTGATGGAFIVRGPGHQTLTGALDISKDVAVGGWLTLAENASLGAQTAGSVSLHGGVFELDNTVTNNNNRLRDGSATSTGLEPNGGGVFRLLGNSGGTAETAGRLQLGAASKTRSGQLTLQITTAAGATAPTVLTIGSLNRDTTTVAHTATVDFAAATAAGTPLPPGLSGNNPRFLFTTAPLASNGLIANSAGTGANGWATVNGADFAAYGANGVTAVTTTAWPAASSATANVLVTAGVTVPVTTFALNSLKLAPVSAGQSITVSSGRSLNCQALLLAGPVDFSITGPGSLGGTGVHYYHVQQAALTVAPRLPNQVCVKAGGGVLLLTSTANGGNTQPFVVENGAVRAQGSSSLPGGEIKLRGGIIELTGGGTFSKTLGFTAGGLNWSEFDTSVTPASAISEDRGSGGFAALGSNVTVDLGAAGPTLIPWEDPGFVQSNFALILGSTRADRTVTLVDDFQLNSTEATVKYSPREIRVVDNPASSTDAAVISGVISGAKYNDLLKTGDGTLELTGTCTFAGATLLQNGTLIVTGSTAAGIATDVLTGATLAGTGSVSRILLEPGGTVAPGKSAPGTLTSSGCIWRGGGVMRFDLGPAGTSDRLALGTGTLRKGSPAGPFTFNFGSTGANGFIYTLATFASTDFLPADFSAAGLPPGVTGTFQITGGNTLVFNTGGPPLPPIETWRQTFFGPAATNSGTAANTADPDADGLTNLDEYVLGSSPQLPTAAAAPLSGNAAGFLTLTFNRNAAATDVTIRIESSDTLAPGTWTTRAQWTSPAGWTNEAGTLLTESSSLVTYRDSAPLSGAASPRRYLRMRSSAP